MKTPLALVVVLLLLGHGALVSLAASPITSWTETTSLIGKKVSSSAFQNFKKKADSNIDMGPTPTGTSFDFYDIAIRMQATSDTITEVTLLLAPRSWRNTKYFDGTLPPKVRNCTNVETTKKQLGQPITEITDGGTTKLTYSTGIFLMRLTFDPSSNIISASFVRNPQKH